MITFVIENGILKKCEGDEKEVVLPKDIIGIDWDAFEGCKGITSITLPEGLEVISGGVFQDCIGLEEFKVEENNTQFTSIDGVLFSRDKKKLIAYPMGKGITTYQVPSEAEEILLYAFHGCTGLTSITLPKGLVGIGWNAFSDCTSLTNITLQKGLVEIGYGAFQGCTSLESITLPKGITTIGACAFEDCTSLTSIALPEGLLEIGDSTFSGCTSLKSISLPMGFKAIAERSFLGCTALEKISLPNGMTVIGKNAFSGCEGLKQINLPEDFDQGTSWLKEHFKWEIIVVSALECCNKDTKIVKFITKNKKEAIDILVKEKRTDLIPALLEKSQKIKLEDLNDLIDYVQEYKDAEVNANLLEYKNKNYTQEENNKLENDKMDKALGIKKMTLGDYKRIFKLKEENGEFIIMGLREAQREVVIPAEIKGKAVTKIADIAFEGCTVLTSITLPKGLETIGTRAFQGCTGLTSITLPEGLVEIGWNAFSNCTGLTSITLPNGLKTIGFGAFSNCTALTSIILPKGLVTIGGCEFRGCTSLTSVTLPEGLLGISWNTFEGCTGLEEFKVEENNTQFTSIDGVLFSRDKKKLIAYPMGKRITTYQVPSEAEEIGDSAFSGCTRLTSITISERLKKIGDNAFYRCIALTDITLPKCVKKIGRWAFGNCPNLTIYCEAEKNPSGWSKNWNPDNRPVVWQAR